MQQEARIPVVGKVWAQASRHAIVDLGACAEAPRRAETLIALGLPRRRNFTPWIQGRLVARVPLQDLPILKEAGAPISEGGTYYQTTHHWTGLGQDEEIAPAECDAYDRQERERRDAERLAAGSTVFNDWKYWHHGTRKVSEALGGIRRYGIRTPIPLSVVARTHGIGRTVVRFIDRCPEWQREDAWTACRTVALEAAERALPLCVGSLGEEIARRCLDTARASEGPGPHHGLIDQSAVSPMWRADPASLAAYAAVQASFCTLHQWMRTGLYGVGDDMMWPMNSACGAAANAHGYAALAATGVRAELVEGERLYAWENKAREQRAFKEAAAAEESIQIERLCELTAFPRVVSR